MKIRIRGNSVRLRLTQSEVSQFEQTGQVSESIQFAPNHSLTYELLKSDVESVQASFENSTIRISIPSSLGNNWAASDQVGIEHFQVIDDQQSLRILVEKDFKCLTVRAHEDESDAFPHPVEGAKC